jgi:hypothetical protein
MGPFAQDYTVVGRSPGRHITIMEPGLAVLPSGRLFASFPFLSHLRQAPRPPDYRRPVLNLCVSDDRGASWQQIGALEGVMTGTPFLHGGALYLLGHREDRKDVVIARSADEGRSWSALSTLFQGDYWNCPTGIAFHEGRLYRAIGGSEANGRETLVIAGDLSRDLLDPAAWRKSNHLPFPGAPGILARGGEPDTDYSHWLEPNVVVIRGALYVLCTVKLTSRDGWLTPGLAALCAIEDDGRTLGYRFLQYHPMPGSQLKCHILYDERTHLYWRTMNLPVDTAMPADTRWEKRGNFGGDRRTLALSYGADGLNWLQAGWIAVMERPWDGFQYAAPCIDGDDLVLLARTAIDAANQHDSNLITFHRVKDFRSLAATHVHARYD